MSDCICGGTGLLTTLTEDGGNTGPFICPRCYVPVAEVERLREALLEIRDGGGDLGAAVVIADEALALAMRTIEKEAGDA